MRLSLAVAAVVVAAAVARPLAAQGFPSTPYFDARASLYSFAGCNVYACATLQMRWEAWDGAPCGTTGPGGPTACFDYSVTVAAGDPGTGIGSTIGPFGQSYYVAGLLPHDVDSFYAGACYNVVARVNWTCVDQGAPDLAGQTTFAPTLAHVYLTLAPIGTDLFGANPPGTTLSQSDLVLTLVPQATVTPEPRAVLLLAGALVPLGAFVRRRQSSPA